MRPYFQMAFVCAQLAAAILLGRKAWRVDDLLESFLSAFGAFFLLLWGVLLFRKLWEELKA